MSWFTKIFKKKNTVEQAAPEWNVSNKKSKEQKEGKVKKWMQEMNAHNGRDRVAYNLLTALRHNLLRILKIWS